MVEVLEEELEMVKVQMVELVEEDVLLKEILNMELLKKNNNKRFQMG